MLEKLAKVIEGYSGFQISPEFKFVEDLGYSSLDFTCLCFEIEEMYSISFGIDEIADIITVGELYQRVEECIKNSKKNITGEGFVK